MSATPTKVYPLAGVSAPGIPHVVHELPSQKAAEEYEATGAFTTNAKHPDRIPDEEIPLPVDAPTHVVTLTGTVPIDQVEAEAPAAPPSTPTTDTPAEPGQEA